MLDRLPGWNFAAAFLPTGLARIHVLRIIWPGGLTRADSKLLKVLQFPI